MKTVILCGGMGTRLKEETEFKPKPLVEIGGKPILWHIMKIYSAFGFNEFILALGYRGEMIKDYFMNYSWQASDFQLDLKQKTIIKKNNNLEEDWLIDFVDTGRDSLTGLRLFKLKDYLIGEDDFMLTYGDGLADINLHKLIAFHKEKNKAITITGLHPRTKYGVVQVDKDGLIEEFREKPVLNDLINGGFMVINKRVFDFLDQRNIMIEEFLAEMSQKREVASFIHNGFWACMDTYKDFLDLNKIWEEKPEWKIWS